MRVSVSNDVGVSSGDGICRDEGSDLNASTRGECHLSMPFELSTAPCIIGCFPKMFCRRLRGAHTFGYECTECPRNP